MWCYEQFVELFFNQQTQAQLCKREKYTCKCSDRNRELHCLWQEQKILIVPSEQCDHRLLRVYLIFVSQCGTGSRRGQYIVIYRLGKRHDLFFVFICTGASRWGAAKHNKDIFLLYTLGETDCTLWKHRQRRVKQICVWKRKIEFKKAAGYKLDKPRKCNIPFGNREQVN